MPKPAAARALHRFLRPAWLGLALLMPLAPGASLAATLSADSPLGQLQQLGPQTLDVQAFDVEKLLGKPAVINFWATWCPPCIREMPDLAALNAELGESVHFVGVAADAPANIQRFLTRNPEITFPLVPVGYRALPLSKQWGNESNGLPFTVILDAKGDIQWRHSGPVNIETLRSVLKSRELH